MVAMAAAEGVKTDLMLRVPGRLPGLYIIETDGKGERRFRYWRGEAPARELFELPNWNLIAESMMGAKLIYFSGVTLSLYSNIGLGRLLAVVEMARQQGAKVAFDGNFRPYGWKGDLPRTRTVFMEALKRVDYALPTFDDEAVLWGDPSPEATVERLQAFGIGEIVVKNGPNSALVAVSGQQEHVPVPEVVQGGRHHGGGRQLQRGLYRGTAHGREPGLGGAGGPYARRAEGAPPRRDHPARRRRGSLAASSGQHSANPGFEFGRPGRPAVPLFPFPQKGNGAPGGATRGSPRVPNPAGFGARHGRSPVTRGCRFRARGPSDVGPGASRRSTAMPLSGTASCSSSNAAIDGIVERTEQEHLYS